jgi:hypothetical protein
MYGGFGFVPRDAEKNGASIMWARENGLDAWINFGKESGVENYRYDNPAYRGFFRELWAGIGGTSNPSTLKAPFTAGDSFAHEALGHAYDWVKGADYTSEARAQAAENIFRAAEGRPTGFR